VIYFYETNINFNLQLPSIFVFLASHKNDLIKSCLSSGDLLAHEISWSYVDWCMFRIHLRSLNVRHFGMVEAKRLKNAGRGYLQWHDLPTQFHKNLIHSKVIRGDPRTGRHTEWCSHKPYFAFKKSRRNIQVIFCRNETKHVSVLKIVWRSNN
jgi:hypothetical protein